MELWLVSIPLDGHPFPKKESDYIKCGEVIFHQYNDPYPQHGKRIVASAIIEGKTDIVVDRAKEIIENAITKLTFTSGLALKLNDEDCYLIPKNEPTMVGIPCIGGKGFRHRVTKSLTLWNYEIDRTVAAHGTLDTDILDAAKIKEANTDAKNLKLWVRKLIIRYLNGNQIYDE